jgi:hypothetical protein
MTSLLAFGGGGSGPFTKGDAVVVVCLFLVIWGFKALNKSMRKEKD